MTEKQKQLKEAHGTPAQFAEAANRAADQLMITTAECEAGIERYLREWEEAGLGEDQK